MFVCFCIYVWCWSQLNTNIYIFLYTNCHPVPRGLFLSTTLSSRHIPITWGDRAVPHRAKHTHLGPVHTHTHTHTLSPHVDRALHLATLHAGIIALITLSPG